MQPRLQLVTLGVRDVAASRAFYSDGLGWEPLLQQEDVTFYQVAPGLAISLFDLAHLGEDTGETLTQGTSINFGQIVDGPEAVDAAVAAARKAGGRVVKEPQRAFWGGYYAYVADPDGYQWEIADNPGWSVDDEGRIALGPVEG